MSDVKPISDEQLARLDHSESIGDRLPEEGSVSYLALRERLRLAEHRVHQLEEKLKLAEAVVEAASKFFQEHLVDFAYGELDNWVALRPELAWGEGCSALVLGDAITAYRAATSGEGG